MMEGMMGGPGMWGMGLFGLLLVVVLVLAAAALVKYYFSAAAERAMTDSSVATGRAAPSSVRSRLAFLVPLATFLALAVALGWGLTRDPREIPSVLIGKPVPTFNLPPVQGRTLGLSSGDLKGEVSLVNFFASWCVACLAEHPLFVELKKKGAVPVHGINYKDRPADAAAWLGKYGDPYTRTGADLDGRVGIDWGVYGLPETFVVSRDGRIVFKHVGAVTPQVLERTILPLIARLSDDGNQSGGPNGR